MEEGGRRDEGRKERKGKCGSEKEERESMYEGTAKKREDEGEQEKEDVYGEGSENRGGGARGSALVGVRPVESRRERRMWRRKGEGRELVGVCGGKSV